MRFSVILVAGARHVLYGENAKVPTVLACYSDISGSSPLIAKTMPTLINSLEPNKGEIAHPSGKHSENDQFGTVPSIHLGMITEMFLH